MSAIQLLFGQPWVDRVGWALMHFLWQGALVTAILAMARSCARKPGTRYALACIALAVMVVAPFVTIALARSASIAPAGAAAAVPDQAAPAAFQMHFPAPAWWQRICPWLVAGWFIGVIAFSIRLIGGWYVATRLRFTAASSAPPEWRQILERLAGRIGVTRPVRLLASAATEVPAVVGWLRPAILVPATAFAGIPAGYLEALLAHELAHIRRHDFLVNMLQKMAEALLFYHPAVWWVSQQIRIERELCCDDLAVATSGDVLAYARALTQLESLRPAHAGLAVAANGASLANRIRRLLTPPGRHSHALPGMGAASLASLFILLGILSVANAQQRPQTVAEPSIRRDAIWIDTVKQGDLRIERRALGTLTSRTSARVMLPAALAGDVRVGQSASLAFRKPEESASAMVARIDGQIVNGMVSVDLQIPTPPESAPAGRDCDATIHIETLHNVLYSARPLSSAPGAEQMLFKLDPDGRQATRVKVQYGRSSVNAIQIRSGLAPGDRVILSDTSTVSKYGRILIQ